MHPRRGGSGQLPTLGASGLARRTLTTASVWPSAAVPLLLARDTYGATAAARRCATVCYMSDGTGRVGVRELRQNLSVYLDRVKAGESLDVTEHGRVVARLGPVVEVDGPLERLRRAGAVREGRASLRELPPPAASSARALSEVLQEMRDEDPR